MKNGFFSLAAFFGITSIGYAADLVVLPETITLVGPEARQHLLVQMRQGDSLGGMVSEVAWQSNNPAIAEVVDGVVIARGDGRAVLTATTPLGVSTREITVEAFAAPFAWSFSHHVLPILTREGCNMGACHGAVAGKGGFRLSLRAYDPPADYYTIAREAQGRRIEMGEPATSLLLTKPTMATAHQGGKRMDPRSREYRILAEWITAGAAAPTERDVPITHIEVLPDVALLKKGDKQPLLVTAHYADGRSDDVTDWAKFASADETIALVGDDGMVEIIGHGEGAVSALYSSKVALARFRAAFAHDIPADVFTSAPRANEIDDLVLAQLQQLRIAPSPRSDDATFLRRAFLDTIGTLPKVAETRAFLADASPDKRTKLIDDLLLREEFVDYWAYRWSDIFLVNGQLLRPDAVKSYYQWVRAGVAANLPWDRMVSEVITARGDSTVAGATNFYAVHQDPEAMAENVSQAFLGLSIGCAKCHDHPLEKWTNDQYYAFANLFSRVRAKGWGGDPRNGDGVRTVYVESRGDLIQPRTGKPQAPAPLDGEILDPDSPNDRREALAAWLTDGTNPFFARSITNRVWAAYFGRGLVDPVDDLRASNPASNEPLLEYLSDYLVAGKFDLKKLMRLILQSETYQRSGTVLEANREDEKYLSRYLPRRLMAEVLEDGIAQVTAVPSLYTDVALKDGSKQKTEFYEPGTRAIELYDSAVQSYFLKTFGRNEREVTCECERSNQPSMIQALHLANGTTLNDKLAAPEGVAARLLKEGLADEAIIEEATLMTLSRLPTQVEKDGFLELLAAVPPPEKHAAVEDIFWAIMTTREFLFQH